MNKILFIGGIDYDNEFHKGRKKNYQNAANLLQWNIINGIEENLGNGIDIINSYFVGTYPKYHSKLIIKSSNWTHRTDSNNYNIGFINLFGLSHIIKKFKIYRKIIQWCKESKYNRNILVYSLYSPFIKAIKKAKKTFPDIIITIIVPDLPEYMKSKNKKLILYNFIKKIDVNYIYKNIKYIDNFVLLTKYMGDKLGIKTDDFIVIEGMVDNTNIESILKNTPKNKSEIILYTGIISANYNIDTLIESFMSIDNSSIELHLCGTGDYVKDVIEKSKIDKRIKYHGQLTHGEVVLMQEKATLLINPRDSREEYTKYSFPSKTMEYLLSGTPVISMMLDGIPDEYKDYIFILKESSVESIRETINYALSQGRENLYKFGTKARKFVLSEKNNIYQTKKILDFIKDRKGG